MSALQQEFLKSMGPSQVGVGIGASRYMDEDDRARGQWQPTGANTQHWRRFYQKHEKDGKLTHGFAQEYLDKLTLVEKGEVNLAALASGNGLLEPAHRNRFLNLVACKPIVLQQITRMVMTSFEQKLNRMEMAGRVLFPVGDEGLITEDQTQSVSFLDTVLRARKFRGKVRMRWDALRDAITDSPDVLQDQILTQMAEQIGEDLECNINEGDTASVDPNLRPWDGIVKAADVNVVPSVGTQLQTTDIVALENALPDRFSQNLDGMRLFMGQRTKRAFSTYLEGRATGLGDAFVRSTTLGTLKDLSNAIVACKWPYNRGGGNNETNVVLANTENIVFGVWQDIRFLMDTDAEGESTSVYVAFRGDLKIEEGRATARLDGLLDPNA